MKQISRTVICSHLSANVYDREKKEVVVATATVFEDCSDYAESTLVKIMQKYALPDMLVLDAEVVSVERCLCTMSISEFFLHSKHVEAD